MVASADIEDPEYYFDAQGRHAMPNNPYASDAVKSMPFVTRPAATRIPSFVCWLSCSGS